MTPTAFAALVRAYTRTNSTTFANADILAFANPFKDEIAAEISKANEDYFIRTFYANLVAGQREYSLPAQVMSKIKYIEAKLDGTTKKHLNEFSLAQYGKGTDEATIIEEFSGKNPAYYLSGGAIGSLFIFSDSAIIEVAAGLEIKAEIFPADITSLTSTVDMSQDPDAYSCGFPRIFHELLARRVSMAWKSSRPKIIPLSEKEQLYEVDLQNKISSIKNLNLDRSFRASVPGNNGQNY